jgi:outer membrane immunogenic protein
MMTPFGASAADFPVKTPPASPVTDNWTGFYLGGHAGDGTGIDSAVSSSAVSTAFPAVSSNWNIHGAFAGLQAGYNALITPHFLLGIEADASFANLQGSYFDVSVPTDTRLVGTNVKDFGTARGRLGAVFDRLLVYGTGGLAWGRIDETRLQVSGSQFAATPGTFEVNSATYVGWTVGGGTEYAVAKHWSVKAEYLYLDFAQHQFVRPISLTLADHHTTANIGRIGVNYRFNGL